jgi:hypothetical protein
LPGRKEHGFDDEAEYIESLRKLKPAVHMFGERMAIR